MKNRKWVLLLLGASLACAAVGGYRAWQAGTGPAAPARDPAEPACGHLCVYRVCQVLGAAVPLEEIMGRLPTRDGTLSLLDLLNEFRAIGFACEGRRETLESLRPTGAGGMVYVAALANPDHFIVLHSVDERGLHVFDNMGNRLIVSREVFAARWTGAVLRVERQAGALVPAYRTAPPHSPRIQVDKLCFDKGSIPSTGVAVPFQYVVRNVGDAELVIHDVQRSCSCITSMLSRSRLAPGESTTLQVAYSADNARGGFAQELVLRSNDPLDPVLTLAACGYLYAGVWSSPPRLDFRTVTAGALARRYLFLGHSDRIEDFQIVGVSCAAPGVTVRECPWQEAAAAGPGELFRREHLRVSAEVPPTRVLEVTYAPPAGGRPGAVDGEVVVRTNVKDFEEIHFPFTGAVEPRVRCFPPVLSFGLTAPAAPAPEPALDLVDLAGDDFEVVAVDGGGLKPDHPPKSAGGRLRVRLSAPPSVPARPAEQVRLRLRTKSGPLELAVPVYFWGPPSKGVLSTTGR
jgi:hypothetical protein